MLVICVLGGQDCTESMMWSQGCREPDIAGIVLRVDLAYCPACCLVGIGLSSARFPKQDMFGGSGARHMCAMPSNLPVWCATWSGAAAGPSFFGVFLVCIRTHG